MVAGLVLLVASVLMLISVIDLGKDSSTGKFVERIAAGVSYTDIHIH